MHITREVVLDADLDEVWNALIDRDQRADWLDDDRPLQILHADTGRSLTWRWTRPIPTASRARSTSQLEATEDGRTRLTVVERATAAAHCTLDQAVIDVEAWDRRLLGLELRCMVRATAPALV